MFNLVGLTFCIILAGISMKKKNTLTTLLMLELFILLIIMTMIISGSEMYHGLMMMCIGACEGAVGLGTMISMTRLKSEIDN